MTGKTLSGGAIRVGDFTVDPRSGELRGEAGRQTLSAQPLQVLLALLERPGELVTRDELRGKLWPADTYVDFEHGLNAVVKRLRDALGDSADTPRYIETIPRRGYRLVADVRLVDERPATMPGPPAAPEPAPSAEPAAAANTAPGALPPAARRRAIRLALAAGVAAIALGSLGYRLGPWRQAEAGDRPVQPVRLTFGPGLQTDAAWSPDGRRLAFAADRDGNFDLFVQTIGGGEPARITSSPANETEPAWSPAGDRLVFRSDVDGGGLYTSSLDGGAVRRIADGFQPAWMPDGRRVAFASPFIQTLHLVAADGGEAPQPILQDALANGMWSSFAVHPDGRIGVLGIHASLGYGFYVSDREHRTLRSMTSGLELPEGLRQQHHGRVIWNKAGDAVFVEGWSGGVRAVWRVPVDRESQVWRQPIQLTSGPAGVERIALSPDGTTLAFTSSVTTVRAWAFPLEAGGTRLGEGRPVTDEDGRVSGVGVDQAGRAIYYQDVRPGRTSAPGVRKRLDTGETTVLTADANSSPIPAPDGSGTAYQLYRTPPAGPGNDTEYALAWRGADGRERLLSPWGLSGFVPTDVRRDGGAVLGTWMRRAFTAPGALAEWPVGPAAVSEPGRVLLESGSKLFWQGHYSPDGRWVAFVAADTSRAGRIEVGLAPAAATRASTWTNVAVDHPWPDKPRWSVDGRILYFLSQSAAGFFDLWGVRIDASNGQLAGEPFRIQAFDSPRWHVDTDPGSSEMGVAAGLLVLPMRSVKGSIWLRSSIGS